MPSIRAVIAHRGRCDDGGRRGRGGRRSRAASPSRTSGPISPTSIGHGQNIVNVALVDLRGWDTMGELSVLVLAATGVASLVFVTARGDHDSARRAPPFASNFRADRAVARDTARSSRRPKGCAVETSENCANQRAWLVGGTTMASESRSMILEVIVRILFHTIIVISIFLLFAGHNLPGGGFAGGLVAGLALVMRYVAGGSYELGIAAPTDAARMLGFGLLLAVSTAAAAR